MNADELRSMQAPLKDKYRERPDAALVTLRAEGRDELITHIYTWGRGTGSAVHLKFIPFPIQCLPGCP